MYHFVPSQFRRRTPPRSHCRLCFTTAAIEQRGAQRDKDVNAGRAGGAGGDLLEEEPHVYIAAMQLFPIKLNFSFIKNADVKVWSTANFSHLMHHTWGELAYAYLTLLNNWYSVSVFKGHLDAPCC